MKPAALFSHPRFHCPATSLRDPSGMTTVQHSQRWQWTLLEKLPFAQIGLNSHASTPHPRFNADTVQQVNPLQIRPILTSNAPVRSSTYPSNYLELSVTQSKCLRVIGNFSRRIPTYHLHDTLNIEPIRFIIHRLAAKCVAHCPSQPNPLVQQMCCSLPLSAQPPGPTNVLLTAPLSPTPWSNK